jgi:hypothetical protein
MADENARKVAKINQEIQQQINKIPAGRFTQNYPVLTNVLITTIGKPQQLIAYCVSQRTAGNLSFIIPACGFLLLILLLTSYKKYFGRTRLRR